MNANDITLRRAVLGDEATLSAIGAATFLESFTETIPGPDLVKHCRDQHSLAYYRDVLQAPDPRYACWIAEYVETGAPIGYAMTAAPDLPTPTGDQDIELKRIYVFSRFHGTGAGKQLNALANSHAAQLACSRILLGTYHENHRAVAFYKREGYTLIGTRQFQVGDQVFDDIIMAKDYLV
ncbi:MAG: GNAT family N-acetyltransferase [Henriciella sp.]|nr:GNAT family N-acetyltransferase [Henriciella sp.]